MSFFSPISRRSGSVRAVLIAIYLALAAGAATMVLPLLLTLSGSVAGVHDFDSLALYPRFMVSQSALWNRFVDARYGGSVENLRMAWGDSEVDFQNPGPPAEPQRDRVALWDAFVAERGLSTAEAGLAFTRPTRREASLENRNFRRWLLDRYDGDLARLNRDLFIEATQATAIIPPRQSRIVLADVDTPFQRAFFEYVEGLPMDRRLPWDVGGFYRAVYLPRIFGDDIGAYNAETGATRASFAEVPFPAEVPAGGEAAPWTRFVRGILNPHFITLTAPGEEAWKASGRPRIDFIRNLAEDGHLRIQSVDLAFADWAAERGVRDARIPARDLDARAFHEAPSFWRWQFVTQNYLFVLDEVMIQGNGVRNTVILVFLTVVGALTINPMAAYALSRFRLPQSYQLLLFFLATIAFPAEVAMIPNFLQLKEMGLLNTFGALVLPGLVNGFSIFLLKGFFDSLPRELYEAADIDGASEWQIFWGFTMSLSKPILAVIALNAFISAYSAFFFALILAPEQSMWTLMVWIYQLRQTATPGIIYASLIITAVPTLVVYLCAQNVILRGIVVPSEK